MLPLYLGKDVPEIVDQLLLPRVFAEHRRHFLLQVTYDVRVHLHDTNTSIISQNNVAVHTDNTKRCLLKDEYNPWYTEQMYL